MSAKQHRQIVHFDRLKLCPPDTRLPLVQHSEQPPILQSSSAPPTVLFGTNLHLVDNDIPPEFPRRYPERIHRPPIRYSDIES